MWQLIIVKEANHFDQIFLLFFEGGLAPVPAAVVRLEVDFEAAVSASMAAELAVEVSIVDDEPFREEGLGRFP